LKLVLEAEMVIFEWNSSYLLGVAQIDEDHKQLVGLLNKVYETLLNGREKAEIEKMLDSLIDYATYHFAAEESWMKDNSYPGLEMHMQEHERFCKRIVEMQKDFYQGYTTVTLELLAFVKYWLLDHILSTDAEAGRYITNKKTI